MKVRESGMPPKDYWNQFFNSALLFQTFLGDNLLHGDAVEFGCGYGTFSFEALNHISGQLNALDIEPDLVEQLKNQAISQNQPRLQPKVIDFVTHGTLLSNESQELALIFNLLHLENPLMLLSEAHRVLKPGGQILLIHWRTDTRHRADHQWPFDQRSSNAKTGWVKLDLKPLPKSIFKLPVRIIMV